ncbi:hypothetical protein GXM_02681 [Nostoc sphaeroides CCNUC1]|uniref:Uncharacterized protein n=1 Tax=Nostoc sphaeroides CCNUC1 TaxID=2653204 RepID=A0A5P8VXU6_9NOSO|nr:hypothetical protein GXM_02681 [Nostoc sphaeroides CCNUC1]
MAAYINIHFHPSAEKLVLTYICSKIGNYITTISHWSLVMSEKQHKGQIQ